MPLFKQDINDLALVKQSYPSFIKYMGSKSKIMDFVLEGINEVYSGGKVLDLFAGSASLAGAIGQQCPVQSNDIQSYSSILANAYSLSYKYKTIPSVELLLNSAENIVNKNQKRLGLNFDYSSITTLEEFNEFEEVQKALLQKEFRYDWHLFVKNYSGTWWSYEQCLWIDALRQVAETYRDTPSYSVILSSLMYAMAYTSQGTGHYAQFRDAKTNSSLKDILIYRKRAVASYFLKKYTEVLEWLPSQAPTLKHSTTSQDFIACLNQFEGGTVYADPPYCFVHYSRFYHALETLVLYDYPNLQVKGETIVKGRYRENRHQSPFSIKTKVETAFLEMFKGVKKSKSTLAMSYSNTGMVTIDKIEELASQVFSDRSIELLTTDHQHMTLGRAKDRHRDVKECLLLIR